MGPVKTIAAKRSRAGIYLLMLILGWGAGSVWASGTSAKTKDEAVESDSDSSADEGIKDGQDSDGFHTKFKDDEDDTYEGDSDSPEDKMNSKFREDEDEEDRDTDSSDEQQGETT